MTERFTVSLDAELAESFERYRQRLGYASRSEAVRDLLRGFLARQRAEDDPDGQCVGILTYIYDHHQRDLAGQLTEAQHEHHDLAVATLHVHLDHDHCLEASVLRGPLGRVRRFADHFVARRGVRHGDLHLVPVEHAAGGHHHGPEADTAAGDSHDHYTPHD
ncbi:MAG: nickel-responsive transcriptional regulator NikR [Wenzhouxiangellaceae bacterium]|nr:nickel-responsive transcriptional regulator NikR [Wenzhouxiangellaceae bacterium]